MKKIVVFLDTLVILACGISAGLPTAIKNAEFDKKQGQISTQTAEPYIGTPTESVRQMTIVDGCWNIRSTASLGNSAKDDNITGLLKCSKEVVTVYGLPVRGWLQIGDGQWICNRAVGGDEECL